MKTKREETQKGLQTCKFCILCQGWKPLWEFYTDRAKTDGLRAYCKSCELAKAKRT